ncbi:hypothetical protein IWW38_001172 [Coemansia aciculifera]|uniref:Uncharacterized protein n=1 Tax=Coemansia aciculifera TaxID=417176 RepID=A0ACC1M6P8_9FUNG|nr:hypothetical protein IWW38_001172 [Coemansia aciculifera]
MSASGMQGAPATKLWLASIGAFSMLATTFGWWGVLRLQLAPALTRNWQWWRPLTSLGGFPVLSKVIVAQILGYQLRSVERLLGTRRFVSFLVVSGIVGQTLTLAGMLLVRVNAVASGPYVLLFACVHQFYLLVPPPPLRAQYVPSVLGAVGVTGNWTVYATAALLLALPRFAMIPTVWPAIAGVLVSMVYSADVAGLKRWRLPVWAEEKARRWIAPMLESSSPPQTTGAERVDVAEAGENAELNVDFIAGMFPDVDRERIGSILRLAGNDPNRAVAALLNSNGSS